MDTASVCVGSHPPWSLSIDMQDERHHDFSFLVVVEFVFRVYFYPPYPGVPDRHAAELPGGQTFGNRSQFPCISLANGQNWVGREGSISMASYPIQSDEVKSKESGLPDVVREANLEVFH